MRYRRSGFPDELTLLHYTAALYAYRGLDGPINSLIISTSATILSAFFGTLMAYSLARFNTGGQHLSFWVLSQRFLPPIAVVLPIFLIYRVLRLNDTHVGLIIAYTVFTLPVSVWMMFAYFRQMPGSLEEAALSTAARAGRASGGLLCRSRSRASWQRRCSPSSPVGPSSSSRSS